MTLLKTRDITLISLFATLMAVGAYVRIPAPVVEITLQTFFAALCPLLLGRKKAVITQMLYVCIGLIGLPVFTGGGGLLYVQRPSFGYVLGFVLLVHVTGYMIEHAKRIDFKHCFLAALCGLFSCYSMGVTYLYIMMRFVLHAEVGNIFVTGFLIFLPGDLIKITIAALAAPRIYKALYLR